MIKVTIDTQHTSIARLEDAKKCAKALSKKNARDLLAMVPNVDEHDPVFSEIEVFSLYASTGFTLTALMFNYSACYRYIIGFKYDSERDEVTFNRVYDVDVYAHNNEATDREKNLLGV